MYIPGRRAEDGSAGYQLLQEWRTPYCTGSVVWHSLTERFRYDLLGLTGEKTGELTCGVPRSINPLTPRPRQMVLGRCAERGSKTLSSRGISNNTNDGCS